MIMWFGIDVRKSLSCTLKSYVYEKISKGILITTTQFMRNKTNRFQIFASFHNYFFLFIVWFNKIDNTIRRYRFERALQIGIAI